MGNYKTKLPINQSIRLIHQSIIRIKKFINQSSNHSTKKNQSQPSNKKYRPTQPSEKKHLTNQSINQTINPIKAKSWTQMKHLTNQMTNRSVNQSIKYQ